MLMCPLPTPALLPWFALSIVLVLGPGCKKSEPEPGEQTAQTSNPLAAFGKLAPGGVTLIPTGGLSTGLAVSATGAYAAVGTSSGLVLLLTLKAGVPAGPARHLEGHSEAVFECAFSADARLLATAGADNHLRVWDVETGKSVVDVAAHDGDIKALSISPDGKLVATGSVDDDVRLWSTSTGKRVRHFSGHTSSVYALLFSPDGARLYSAGRDATVRSWNVETGKSESTSEKLPNSVVALRLVAVPGAEGEPKETRLVALGLAGQVEWLSTDALESMGTREVGSARLNEFDADATGTLFIGEAAGQLGAYYPDPAKEGVVTVPFQATPSEIDAVRVVPNQNAVYVLGDNGLSRWALPLVAETGARLDVAPPIDGGLRSLAVAGGPTRGPTAVVSRGKLVVVPAADGAKPTVTDLADAKVNAATWSGDGKLIVVGLEDGALQICDPAGKPRGDPEEIHRRAVTYLAAGGSWVVSAGRDGRVWRIKPETLEKVEPDLSEHQSPLVALAVDPAGAFVATGERNDVTVVRELKDDARIIWTKLGRDVSGLAFTPDGKQLAMIENDSTVTIFDIGKHSEVRQFKGHTEAIMALAYHPSAPVLATLDVLGAVRAWSLDDGSLLASAATSGADAVGLAFSAGGQELVVGASAPKGSIWRFRFAPAP